MRVNLWRIVECVSTLLEPAERQSVLGDIQERGADVHALFDVTGLVLARQVQAWASWRTWLLAATLLLPAFAVVSGAYAVGNTAAFYPWPDVTEFSRQEFTLMIFNSTIAIIALAWASGYTLGVIAGRHALAVLPPLAILPVWLHTVVLEVRDHTELAGIAVTALALAPAIVGMRRGWSGTPLRPRTAVVLALMCVPFAFLLPNTSLWSSRIIGLLAFWPAFYAVVPPRRSHVA